ncbi:MAG: J domain-containing protein [Polyangiaceae bacterium]
MSDGAQTSSVRSEGSSDDADAAALAEDVDLDANSRRRILATHRDLSQLDHYALLAVDRTADRKAIKRAYFDAAALYHPDRYFRKRLGSFKGRLEAIFSRITLAHDTLADADKRSEYDIYLRARERTRSIESALSDAAVEAERARAIAEREAAVEVEQEQITSEPAPLGSALSAAGPAPPTVAAAARRDAFARRLLGGRRRSSSQPPSPARESHSPSGSLSTADAMAVIKQRYEQTVANARLKHARHYVARGEASLASGDAVSAANALRVAVGLSPGDPELERKARDAQDGAEALLREAYARQAGYEEKTGQYAEAARSWMRVCEIASDDADAHERAAAALLQAGGDLDVAGNLARRACAIDPNVAHRRVTLADVYIAAGLTGKARQEIETALQLFPSDGTILAMMKRIGVSG